MATKKTSASTTKSKVVKKKPLRAKKSPVAAKTVRAKMPSPSKAKAMAPKTLSAEERNHQIQVAAYLLAEARGFVAGCEVQDWLAAEQQVDAQMGQVSEQLN